jgi:hypothetical protein
LKVGLAYSANRTASRRSRLDDYQIFGIESNQYFYHNDHLGGINVITDISCIEVQRNEYDPWGSVSKAVGNIERPIASPARNSLFP